MMRWSRWFRSFASRGRAAARGPRPDPVRPRLERLEDRNLLSLGFQDINGPPPIANVQVESLFLGNEWSSDPTQGLRGQVNSFLQTVAGKGSPYVNVLGQYGVGPGTLDRSATEYYVNDPQMTETLDDSQIQSLLANAITQTWLPNENGSRLYFVFTAPGEVVNISGTPSGPTSTQGIVGYHSSYTASNGTPIYYAVIPYPGYPNVSDGLPTTLDNMEPPISHEFAEATTDPEPPRGWIDPVYENSSPGGEIGDLANRQGAYDVLWNGYYVQPLVNLNEQVVYPMLPTVQYALPATAGQLTSFYSGFADNSPGPRGGALSSSDFSASIYWGDGSESIAQVVPAGNGSFSIMGTHLYLQPGTYNVTLQAADPYYMKSIAQDTVTVNPAQITATGQPIAPGVNTVFTTPVAYFQDHSTDTHGSPLPAADFSAVISWGDGQVSAGQVVSAGSAFSYAVNGTHAYYKGGTFTVSVQIVDPYGTKATTQSAAKVPQPTNQLQQLEQDLLNQVSTAVLNILKGLESGNYSLAYEGFVSFESALYAAPPSFQSQLESAFYSDFLADL